MPDSDPINRTDLLSIIESANKNLNSVEGSPFTPQGFATLKGRISEYIVNLINESLKISKRYKTDSISSSHVEKANEYLLTTTSKKIFRHLGTLGGLFSGAFLSNLLTMIMTNQITTSGVVLSSVLGFLGAFMIALHIAKDS
ncbi:MAG: hypothetical protein ACE5HI_19855 [bacterium]